MFTNNIYILPGISWKYDTKLDEFFPKSPKKTVCPPRFNSNSLSKDSKI